MSVQSVRLRRACFIRLYKIFLSSVLAVCLVAFVAASRRWLLVGDAPLFHYIVFLMRHGMAPYRDIIDPNLPGTYFIQAAAIRVFGPGALGWRMFDFMLVGTIGLAGWSICGRRRFAALFAFGVFALVHGRDGLIETGQRDLIMTALLVGAAAFLLRAMQFRTRAAFACMAGFGFCVGLAGTVKPPALLLLPIWLFLFRRTPARGGNAALLLTAAGAALIAPLAAFAALARWHALGPFAAVMEHLVPLHAGMFRLPLRSLLAGSISSVMLGVFAAWLPVAWREKPWKDSKSAVLLTGFVFGIASFVMQGRGYPYHRYPSEAFLLLLAARSFEAGLSGRSRAVAVASGLGLAFGALMIVPESLAAVRHFGGSSDEYGAALTHELAGLGQEGRLDGEVQCLDQAGGCITALYDARLVQSTGYLYDCYLFIKPGSKERRNQMLYREGFLRALAAKMPRYFIVTSDNCGLRGDDFSYSKLQAWPAFVQILQQQYVLLKNWTPSEERRWGGKPKLPYGFRIYGLNNNEKLHGVHECPPWRLTGVSSSAVTAGGRLNP